MNILIINHYAGSPQYGMEFRPYYLAKYWQDAGHKVKIIAASYSHLRTVNPQIESKIAEEIHEGIQFTWVKAPEYNGNGIKRVINIFTFLLRVLFNTKKILHAFKPDLVLSDSTYPLDSYLGAYYKRKFKCIHFHQVHDLWPLTLKEIGGFKSYHPFIIMLQIAENFAYKKSDAVISMLPNAKPYMLKHCLKENNFYHIPNGYYEKEWIDTAELPEEHKKLLTQLKAEGKFIVMYAGGHALSNSLDQLLDCAKTLTSKDNISFVLVGKGTEKERLLKKAEQLALKNTYFLSPVSKNCIPNLLSHADSLFIGWHYSPLYEHGVSPNKLIDYMLAGKPIIHAVCFKGDIVEQCGCGFSVNSGDVESITRSVVKLANTPENERLKIGSKGKEFALNNFNYKVLSEKFLEIYNQKNIIKDKF